MSDRFIVVQPPHGKTQVWEYCQDGKYPHHRYEKLVCETEHDFWARKIVEALMDKFDPPTEIGDTDE